MRQVLRLALVALATAAPCTAGPVWQVETVADGRTFDSFDIGVDAFGQVHVAYGGDRVYYAVRSGSGWTHEIADPTSGAGNPLALVIDRAGRVGIAYRESLDPRRLLYARRGGVSWAVEEIPGSRSFGKALVAILDPGGLPAVAHHIDNSQVTYRFSRFDGSSWVTDTLYTRVPYGGVTSAFDRAGTPWVAFTHVDGGLRVTYNSGPGWVEEVVEVGASPVWDAAMAIDPVTDTPVIAYRHRGRSVLRLARRVAGSWVLEDVDTSGSVGFGADVAVDSFGVVHVSYIDGGRGVVRHAWSGPSWQREDVSAPVVEPGSPTRLALDGAGLPWVAFLDGVAAALVVTSSNGSGWTSETIDQRHNPRSFPLLAFDLADQPVMKVSKWVSPAHQQASVRKLGGIWVEEDIDTGVDEWLGDFAIDPAGNMAFATIRSATSTCAVARHDGVAWQSTEIDPNMLVWYDPSVVIDANGAAHLAFVDAFTAFVIYATDATGAWVVEPIEDIGVSNPGGEPTIRLDSAGRPVVAYAKDAGGLYTEIHVATRSAGWSIDVAIGPSANDHLNHDVGLALLPGDEPVIAVRDDDVRDIRVMRKVGANWVPLPSPANEVESWTPVEVDLNGNPTVVYTIRSSGALMYSTWDGSGWLHDVIDPDTVYWFRYTLDRMGRPAIAYEDVGDAAIRLARLLDGNTILRGETMATLASYAEAVLPWDDPEPVLTPGAPSLLFYQVNGVPTITLVKAGQSVRLQSQ